MAQSRNVLTAERVIALVVQANLLQSLNYNPAGTPPFSLTGSRFDLADGDIQTPGLFVDGAAGDLFARGNITAETLTIINAAGNSTVYNDYTTQMFPSVVNEPTSGLQRTGTAGPVGSVGITQTNGNVVLQTITSANRAGLNSIVSPALAYARTTMFAQHAPSGRSASVLVDADDTLQSTLVAGADFVQVDAGDDVWITAADTVQIHAPFGVPRVVVPSSGPMTGSYFERRTDWAPAYANAPALTLLIAHWCKFGNTIRVTYRAVMGGAGPAGTFTVGVPVLAANGHEWQYFGSGVWYDASLGQHRMLAVRRNGSGVGAPMHFVIQGAGILQGSDFGAGDSLDFSATYWWA